MKLIRLMVPAALLLLCWDAFAGAYAGVPVYIDNLTQSAGGTLYATRFDPSTSGADFIGCALGSGNRGAYGYCSARAGADKVGCVTYDQKIIDVIATINTFSWVYFEWGARFEGTIGGITHYDCLHVTVATRSQHIPDVLAPPTP